MNDHFNPPDAEKVRGFNFMYDTSCVNDLINVDQPSPICPRDAEFALDESNIDISTPKHICTATVLYNHHNLCQPEKLCDTCVSNPTLLLPQNLAMGYPLHIKDSLFGNAYLLWRLCSPHQVYDGLGTLFFSQEPI